MIDQPGLDRPVLVAWSYGGFIVTDYVRAYGEGRIAGLNLVAGAGAEAAGASTTSARASSRTPATPARPTCRRTSPPSAASCGRCTAQPLGADDWSAALGWNMVVPPEVRGALIAREIDGDDVLSRLTVPVLVTHGRADTIVLPSMAEHVLDVCATARASWYDGVGHLPFVEDPARFDRELRAFALAASREEATDAPGVRGPRRSATRRAGYAPALSHGRGPPSAPAPAVGQRRAPPRRRHRAAHGAHRHLEAPVDGRVAVRGVNLDGDDQADRTVHGGPDKAVYAYGIEDTAGGRPSSAASSDPARSARTSPWRGSTSRVR